MYLLKIGFIGSILFDMKHAMAPTIGQNCSIGDMLRNNCTLLHKATSSFIGCAGG